MEGVFEVVEDNLAQCALGGLAHRETGLNSLAGMVGVQWAVGNPVHLEMGLDSFVGMVGDEYMGGLPVEGDEVFQEGEMVVELVLVGKLAC